MLYFLYYSFLIDFFSLKNGDAGYRSPCPSHAKRMLYHLSYIPYPLNISYFFLLFDISFFSFVISYSLDFFLFYVVFLFFFDFFFFFSPLDCFILSYSVLYFKMHWVGFEPTRMTTVVLETTPLDRSGTNAFLLDCIVFLYDLILFIQLDIVNSFFWFVFPLIFNSFFFSFFHFI